MKNKRPIFEEEGQITKLRCNPQNYTNPLGDIISTVNVLVDFTNDMNNRIEEIETAMEIVKGLIK